jgi:hypothetical protein
MDSAEIFILFNLGLDMKMAKDCSVGGIMIEQQNSGSSQKRNVFFYFVHRYVLVPVKYGMRSGFSKCWNPSSIPGFRRNSAGMLNLDRGDGRRN